MSTSQRCHRSASSGAITGIVVPTSTGPSCSSPLETSIRRPRSSPPAGAPHDGAVVKLVVFDFDGLILDTERPVYDAWQELYGEHGHTLPLETWARCIGTADTFDPCVDLAERVGRVLD